MSFLVPLFLLGLAGIAVPIVVHLTRRQRRNVVRFPSLMFLQRIPYQEQRRRRVQNWFLLLLRALALALIVFAFARPFLDRSEQVAGTATGPREMVLLVDRSYSMEVGDRLERVRSEVADIIGGMGPLDRVSLVTFDQSANVLLRSTTDRGRVSSVMDTVAAGAGITRFGPALRVAQTILDESGLPNGVVYLLSDFQRTGWAGEEAAGLPPGSEFQPILVADPSPENVQVIGVALPRSVEAGRERVTPTVRLARRGGAAAAEVPVTLEIDGQPIQTVSVSLAGDGAATALFRPVTVSRAHTRGTVSVPTDPVPSDDQRHFVVSPGSALAVRLVGRSTGDDPNLYLRRALGISQDGRFAVTARRGAGLAAADTENTDVLILNDIRVDGAAAERLRSFVEQGGGVLVALGENAAWPGSAMDLLPATPGASRDREAGRGARLGQLTYDHPVFEVFSGPRSGDFGNARFFRARDVTVSDSAEVLARFDDGSVALAELTLGRGRVLLWTSTLDDYWNDLALQPVYLPFLHRITEHLAGRTEAQQSFTVGQVVDLGDERALEAAGLVSSAAPGLAEGEEQVALTPSGAGIRMPAAATTRYLTLEQQGFYTIRPPGSVPDRPFTIAVNVDVEESDLTAIEPEDVALQIQASSARATEAGSEREGAQALLREDQERRQSLWRWILAAALGLLILETVLSNWASRRTSLAPGATSP
jgi:hypothetical protein